MNWLDQYFSGIGILFKGFRYFWANKALRRLAFVPVLLVGVLFFVGAYSAFQFIPWIKDIALSVFTSVFGDGSGWLGETLFWIISIFLYISYFFVILGSVYFFSILVAIPFNALIAEKTLDLKGISYIQPKSAGDWINFNFQMVLTGLIKTAILIVLSLPMFVLSLIPFVGILAAFYSVFIIAYDSCDYALELKGKKLKERWDFVKQNFWLLTGYTTIVAVFFSIPVVNIFMIPVFITSGSLLVGEVEDHIT